MAIITDYTLVEKLRTNTLMVTYRGIRLHDKQAVILKLPGHKHPSSKQIALLQNEYALLKQLNLPGVIKAYDFIQLDLLPILILEDVKGELLELFLDGRPLDLTVFFNLALQLTDIVGQLHEQHIIHKDINPANIIVETTTLKIKLVDLSISTQLSEEVQAEINPSMTDIRLGYIS